MELDCLRQGDILKRIPFPLLAMGSLQVLGRISSAATELSYPNIDAILSTHRNDPNYFTGQVLMRLSFGAVISQCCELEPRNGKLIGSSFSIARLIQVKDNILADSEKLASLKANRDPRSSAPGFFDYFYVEPHERLDGKEWMVDYSQIVSLPKSEFPGILAHKILQMDDRSRVRFKMKLAAYLGRLTEEETRDKLEEPW